MKDELRWLLTGLVKAEAISIDQLNVVEKYCFACASMQEAKMKALDDEFWDEEGL
jgi:hypothetical protein